MSANQIKCLGQSQGSEYKFPIFRLPQSTITCSDKLAEGKLDRGQAIHPCGESLPNQLRSNRIENGRSVEG